MMLTLSSFLSIGGKPNGESATPALPDAQTIDFAALFASSEPMLTGKSGAPELPTEFSFAPKLPDSVPINLPMSRIIPVAPVRFGDEEAAVSPEVTDRLTQPIAPPPPEPQPSDNRLMPETPSFDHVPAPMRDDGPSVSPSGPPIYVPAAEGAPAAKSVLDIAEPSQVLVPSQGVTPQLPLPIASLPSVFAPQDAVKKPPVTVLISPLPVHTSQSLAPPIVAQDAKIMPTAPQVPTVPAGPISPPVSEVEPSPDAPAPGATVPKQLVASPPALPEPKIVLSPRQVNALPRTIIESDPVIQPTPNPPQPIAPVPQPSAPELPVPLPAMPPQPRAAQPVPAQPGRAAPIDAAPPGMPMAGDPQPVPTIDSPQIRSASPEAIPARPEPDSPLTPRLVSEPISPPDKVMSGFADESGSLSLTNAAPTRVTGAEPPVTTLPQRPDLPVHIARQLVEASRAMPDRPVELSLSPAELGRVRMVMTAVDEAMTVAIVVERGETLDLMRRNIDALAAEFRQLGYRDLSFSFSQQQQDGGGTRQQGQGSTTTLTPPPVVAVPMPVRVDLASGTGMDIRL